MGKLPPRGWGYRALPADQRVPVRDAPPPPPAPSNGAATTARATPTFSEIKAAIRTGLGGDTEEGCGCESRICSAADAVLALLGKDPA